MRAIIMAFCAVLALAGCAAPPGVWATDEAVARAAYRHDGPPRLTLFTMLNNSTGSGAHTSLMINGSQRVIWDPAGSFKHETIPERNDVVFGVTPMVEDVYTRFHARKTFHVRIQRLDVTAEQAERAMQLARAYGPVPQAQCARSTSSILAQIFPSQIGQTWFPRALADEFATIPGVTEETLYEYDSDDNSKVLAAWDPSKV
ncbi:hypothetical protein [Roseovarius nanhaiticus]|uniref:Lipoprotein n=1 Tax=Roseovarius nanhaiticus TaxID=573024 RepID=A0A1N7HKI6_9RHOB|nr:hypothetical protein [Roseovarius nanhaiticus]SEL24448.1 hypothetical protein SAMN05216208_3181 [Roseovarius nanhaiticus]SIS25198.1 hypothetical protein SAMN05421666_3205 [Roseovarius nanhaiticus]